MYLLCERRRLYSDSVSGVSGSSGLGDVRAFYDSKAWRDLVDQWPLADETADICLFATALLAGLSIGEWEVRRGT